MPTPRKGARLGGSPAHQRLILANLATALFEHGRITTTETRARVLRPVAEKLITKARKGDLHNRREVLKTIRDKSVVHTLFTEIAPTFAERPGGYTRITKLGPRKGDNAPMAVIELVTEAYTPTAPKRTEVDRRGRRAGGSPAPAAEVEKPAEDAPAEVEATDEAGETQVLETEAADVETAEAQSEARAERPSPSRPETRARDRGRLRCVRGRREGLSPTHAAPAASRGPFTEQVRGPLARGGQRSAPVLVSRVLVYVEPQQPADEVDDRAEHEDHRQRPRSDRGAEQPADQGAQALDRAVAPAERHRRVPGEGGSLRGTGAQVGAEVDRDPERQHREGRGQQQ